MWRAVVAEKPADWFNEANLALLRRCCTTAVLAERLHSTLDTMKVGTAQHTHLFKLVLAMNVSLGKLAAKLSLTPRQTIDLYTWRGECGIGDEGKAPPPSSA